MRRMPSLTSFGCGLACAALLACLPPMENYAGKLCDVDSDCPEPLQCVAAAGGQARVCATAGAGGASGPGAPGPGAPATGGTDGGGTGTGTGGTGTGGGGPYYCQEVKPILDGYCASCHRSPATGGAPATFRLDVYTTTGGLPGAREKAARILARAASTPATMPPSSAAQPSAQDRAVLAAWVAAGAPECEDAEPREPIDPDTNSVGWDGGTVSFSAHVKPLFATWCAGCHAGANPQRKLNLVEGNVYAAVMADSERDSHRKRVVPYSPQQSVLWLAIDGGYDRLGPMPDGTPGLRVTALRDFEVIDAWIRQGAPNN